MISFIYFDLGGVVVDDLTGKGKWQKLMDTLGVKPEDNPAVSAIWSRYRKELCTTRSVDTLVPILNEEVGLNLPNDYQLQEVMLDLFWTNPAIWPVLEDTQTKTRIGLLTNMYPHMFERITEKEIVPNIVWDKVVDSSIEGVTKPDLEIYQLAQERATVPNENILFVDNEPKNIDGAKAAGWQTFFYNSSDHEKSVLELKKFLAKQELIDS